MTAVASQTAAVPTVDFNPVSTDVFNIFTIGDDFATTTDDSSEGGAQSPLKRQRVDEPAADTQPNDNASTGHFMSAEQIFNAQLMPYLCGEIRRLEDDKLNIYRIAIEVCLRVYFMRALLTYNFHLDLRTAKERCFI